MGLVRFGVHRPLDDAATEMIRKSMEGVTSMAEKSDILTPWKEKDRQSREVYSTTGTPDSSTRLGMYNRAWNSRDTHLNSRDGVTRASRTGGINDFVQNHIPGDFATGLGNHLGEAGFDQ